MRLKLVVLLLLGSVLQLRAQSILGTVVDAATQQPVAGVSVLLIDASSGISRQALSDDLGRFVIVAPESGRYRLRTQRIGYAQSETEFIQVKGDETVTVEVSMPVSAVNVAPILVQQRTRRISSMLQDFYDRKDRGVNGVFLTRADIEQRNPQRLTDLLGEVPGLDVSSANSAGGRNVRVTRAIGPEACPLNVYVDGRQYKQFDASGLDTFNPHDLDGIEIYKGLAEVPAEFGGGPARCGVLALWTRRSQVPPTDPRHNRGTELRFIGALTATVLLALLHR